MSTCTKCLKNEATLRCKMCHRPICKDCGISAPAGTFCSEACAQKMQSHMERVQELDKKKPIIKRKELPTVVKLIIVLAVLWLVARFVLHIDVIERIKELISSLGLNR